MKTKKLIALALMGVMSCSVLAGCSQGKVAEKDGKVYVYDGTWPEESAVDGVKDMEAFRDDFQTENPDIVIVDDAGNYIDPQTYAAKANAKQLPTFNYMMFTEVKANAKAGYLRDITEIMKKNGLDTALNDQMLDLVTYDGKIYGIPDNAYAQGLEINLNLFEQAGLIENGKPKVPNTWQELAETAKIIREKTGKAGYALPTINNQGGWHFMNIAWSYGVEFMKQENDGSYTATFDSQEMRDALQYMYDLKWKYNALPDDIAIDKAGLESMFGSDEVAMMVADPPTQSLTTAYDMNIDAIYADRVPAGPSGRFAQMGGGIVVFSPEATDAQVEAALKWLKFRGKETPTITEEEKERQGKSYENDRSKNCIILPKQPMTIWKTGDRYEEDIKLRAQYTNVKAENYENYLNMEDVTIKPEEPVCCQELYAILDKLIQEVFTNENANIDELVKTANNDFQVNHLDKMD